MLFWWKTKLVLEKFPAFGLTKPRLLFTCVTYAFTRAFFYIARRHCSRPTLTAPRPFIGLKERFDFGSKSCWMLTYLPKFGKNFFVRFEVLMGWIEGSSTLGNGLPIDIMELKLLPLERTRGVLYSNADLVPDKSKLKFGICLRTASFFFFFKWSGIEASMRSHTV